MMPPTLSWSPSRKVCLFHISQSYSENSLVAISSCLLLKSKCSTYHQSPPCCHPQPWSFPNFAGQLCYLAFGFLPSSLAVIHSRAPSNILSLLFFDCFLCSCDLNFHLNYLLFNHFKEAFLYDLHFQGSLFDHSHHSFSIYSDLTLCQSFLFLGLLLHFWSCPFGFFIFPLNLWSGLICFLSWNTAVEDTSWGSSN